MYAHAPPCWFTANNGATELTIGICGRAGDTTVV